MKYTVTKEGSEARRALKDGIDQLARPVVSTMGARGRNGVYREYNTPVVTNDGVSIARKIKPRDSFERMGADLILQASEKTNEEAGDGTSGTVALGDDLAEKGMELLDSGKNPMVLRKELEAAGADAVELLKKMSVAVQNDEDILNVAKISVEDDKIAQIITDATKKAGKNGAIVVVEGQGYNIEQENSNGYFWNRGYISPYMITDPEKNESVLENPVVIVTDRLLNLNKDLMQVLSEVHASGATSALVIADSVEGELLQSIIANRIKGIFLTVVVKRPPTPEELEDVATLVNATAVTKDKGYKKIEYSHLGKAKRVIVKKDKITIITDPSDAVKQRIADLEKDIENDKETENVDESKRERLAKLSDGVVVLRVGAKTEAERKYKKLKVDDAVCATKAALEEGVVDGGGVALTLISAAMTKETDGARILSLAMLRPYEQILKNAAIPLDGRAYNVLTGEPVESMVAAGIIDPTKVVRCQIENAVSFAATFLTIESVTVTEDTKEDKSTNNE